MDIKIIEKNKRFIPEFNGNKKAPAAEQMSIHFESFPGPMDNYKKVYRKDGAIAVEYDDVSLLLNHVDHFDNFTIQSKEIKTPLDFIKESCKVLTPLVVEIRNYAQGEEELSTGESKASE